MGNNNAPNQGMGGGMSQNQMQGPGPMRNNRQNDRQQNRGTPYKQNIQNNGAGGNRGNFQQRRNNDNGQMGAGNGNMPMTRFDNMPMDRQSSGQGFGGSQSSMNSNNMMNNRNYNDDNSFGFGEDRRGFALPSFPNDMGQNNFGNNDRQNNSGMGGNRRNNGKFRNAWKFP